MYRINDACYFDDFFGTLNDDPATNAGDVQFFGRDHSAAL